MGEHKMELYRKYRPSTFDEVVGNEMAIKTIRKELKHGSHVFLITGSAGTGKTTLSRIMAAYLKAGPMSIFEINSAENRGIDSAREIMEKMRYNPSDGESMVYILDEFHQQTRQAQEAFLKPLEDTPSHVYFFICTTNPEKLIAPLKSRCSLIAMKPLRPEEMEYLLIRTAEAEKIEISENVIARIIEMADGGSRKALKLLGKVLYLETDKERVKALRDAGTDDEAKETIDFCRALLKADFQWAGLMGIVEKLDLTEPESIRRAVLGYMTAVLKNQPKFNKHAALVLDCFSNNTYDTGKAGIILACADLYREMTG
jgi:DNA polymerase-3 subunit gamma/tau